MLLDAVRAVAAGHSYVDPSVSRQAMAGHTDGGRLTPRELDVLKELARGASNKKIANSLGIAEETVRATSVACWASCRQRTLRRRS